MGFHERAAIVSSGDEIVIGQLLDTNSRFFAERLTALGILPVEHVTVPDEAGAIEEALRRLAGRVPLVVMSGGLGPTDGDLTRPGLARAMGEELVTDAGALAKLKAWMAGRGRELGARQLRQAQRPASAVCLMNEVGTAPGLHGVIRGEGGRATDVFCLPGPPGELRAMWAREVVPRLRVEAGRVLITRRLQIVGLGEGPAVERLGAMTKREAMPLVGITASGGILTLRIRYEGRGAEAAREGAEAVARVEREAREKLSPHVFGVDDERLEEVVVRELGARGARLATVESCTGGMLGSLVTSVAGSSAVYEGGWVTYSNEAKVREVGVEAGLIERHGAVSAEVARAMAVGGMKKAGADVCVAITGIAGPDGGTQEKPVGTVWIAAAFQEKARAEKPGGEAWGEAILDVRRFVFPGERDEVRVRASRAGLAMAWLGVTGGVATGVAGEKLRLLWER